MEEIEEEASVKSKYFLNKSHNANQLYLIWEASLTDPRDIRQAVIKAKMLAGAHEVLTFSFGEIL